MNSFPLWNTWISLTFCLALSAHALEAPGACEVSDEAFNTEEGGCLNFNGGAVWGAAYPASATYVEAETKCRASRDSGRSDWKLPAREDFKRSVAADARHHLSLKSFQFYWTSSAGDDAAWSATLSDTEDREYVFKTELRNFVCVRYPADRDKDGVPDSSDRCSRTKEGEKVRTTDQASRKGCAETDILFRAGAGCLVDDEHFQSMAPRGCRDMRTGLVWSNEIKQPASWYQAVYEFCAPPWRVPTANELQRVGSQRSLSTYFPFSTEQDFWSNNIHRHTSLVFVNLETGKLGTQYVHPWSSPGGTYDSPGTGYYTGIRGTLRAAICVRPGGTGN